MPLKKRTVLFASGIPTENETALWDLQFFKTKIFHEGQTHNQEKSTKPRSSSSKRLNVCYAGKWPSSILVSEKASTGSWPQHAHLCLMRYGFGTQRNTLWLKSCCSNCAASTLMKLSPFEVITCAFNFYFNLIKNFLSPPSGTRLPITPFWNIGGGGIPRGCGRLLQGKREPYRAQTPQCVCTKPTMI